MTEQEGSSPYTPISEKTWQRWLREERSETYDFSELEPYENHPEQNQ